MRSELHAAQDADTIPHRQHNFLRICENGVAEYIPRMVSPPLPTDFQMRVRARLAELRMSANAASVRADLSRETVRKLLEPGAGLPRGNTLKKLAQVLETTEQFLLTGETFDKSEATAAAERVLISTDGDVEIKGAVAGSHLEGAFQLMDNTIGYTPLPRALRRYTNVYAVIVINDSMIPEHKPGEIRFATPDARPKLGDTVLVEFLRDPDRGPEAMLGHLEANSAVVKIGKLNPKDVVEIESRSIMKLHRIAPTSEVMAQT